MQDNELYKFFSERKHTADEMPGENLWAKIESGLNSPPSPAVRLSPVKIIIVATTAIIGITGGLFIYNNISKANSTPAGEVIPPLPPVTDESITAEPFSAAEQADTVKKKTKIKPAVSFVPFKRFADTSKTRTQTYKNFGPAKTDSVTLLQEPVTTAYGNTIKITTNKTLTKTEFDTLVARTLRLYEGEAGKIVLIRAKGYKLYRKVIQAPELSLVIDTATFRSAKINFSAIADNIVAREIIHQDDRIYNGDQVTTQPEYPGGIKAFYKLIKDNVAAPKALKKDAKAFILYVIEKDGSLSNINVMGDDIGLTDETAAQILEKAHKWKPGQLKGQPVRYRYALPLNFKAKK